MVNERHTMTGRITRESTREMLARLNQHARPQGSPEEPVFLDIDYKALERRTLLLSLASQELGRPIVTATQPRFR